MVPSTTEFVAVAGPAVATPVFLKKT
jgi:hypothetical protein